MAFANSLQEKIGTLAIGSSRRVILQFLSVNARGRANVQSWDDIEAHLHGKGLRMEKESFQTGLLADTREGEVFIGSSRLGYYVIENREDAVATMEFSQERLASHNARLLHLNDLVTEEGWQELPIHAPPAAQGGNAV